MTLLAWNDCFLSSSLWGPPSQRVFLSLLLPEDPEIVLSVPRGDLGLAETGVFRAGEVAQRVRMLDAHT